jgi:hypothetical protein
MAESCETWEGARAALLWTVDRADEGAFDADDAELSYVSAVLQACEPGRDFETRCGSWVLFVLAA